MKKITLMLTLIGAFAAGSVSAAGIPVFDAAGVTQAIAQYQQLAQQLIQMKQQYAAITGSYGRGQLGLATALSVTQRALPGTWQEVVSQQQQGAFGSKQQFYEKLIQTVPQELFRTNPKAGAAYKLSTDSVRAAMAGGDALYGAVQSRIQNITMLSQQIDNTANTKDAQDLQNRLAAEQGLLQTDLAKMQSLTVNLQANLLNEQNQGKAANANFFNIK
ncbi:type IV secretion system protein [Chromobacterium vaccinii]|uniref:type IV secretion system protein n=1 Tax=Chromobacterium vaccinii TaxID=1108595 RepID=UPI0034587993